MHGSEVKIGAFQVSGWGCWVRIMGFTFRILDFKVMVRSSARLKNVGGRPGLRQITRGKASKEAQTRNSCTS